MRRFSDAREVPERWPTIPVVSVAVWHAVGMGLTIGVATVGMLASISTHELTRSSLLFYVGAVGVRVVLWLLVRRRAARWMLSLWPLTVFGGLACASAQSPHAAALCTSTTVLAFLYTGLTQPRGASLPFLPPAVAAYVTVSRTIPAGELAVRTAVVLMVCVAATELPAWLTVRLRFARAELARLAATDPLTGLTNRRYWDDELASLLEDGHRPAVLLIDLDHFKRFNDERGHLAGDEMLVAFARVIEQSSGPGVIAARWGGEEFAVAVHDRPRAEQVAEEIRRHVPLGQTCSIGLVEYRTTESLTELMQRADGALYRAKAAGRDRVVAA